VVSNIKINTTIDNDRIYETTYENNNVIMTIKLPIGIKILSFAKITYERIGDDYQFKSLGTNNAMLEKEINTLCENIKKHYISNKEEEEEDDEEEEEEEEDDD